MNQILGIEWLSDNFDPSFEVTSFTVWDSLASHLKLRRDKASMRGIVGGIS